MAASAKSMGIKSPPKKLRKRTLEEKTATQESDNSKKQKKGFSEIDFKFHLNDSSTIFTGLEKFVDAATDWSNGEGDDIVLAYCRSSPECEEVLRLLDTQGRKVSELQDVFLCLREILLRIADDLGKHYTTGQTVMRKLLTVHAGLLHKTLNMKNKSSQIKSALKLLVAMVMLGSQSAKLVMSHVDIGHVTMLPLLKRRDTKDEEDVRTCFIHLIVAFLLSGDSDIVRRLIQTKGLMESVFQGIQYDRVSTIQLLISTLLENVILNTRISKTAKVHMFTNWSLKELALLYSWKGPGQWKDSLSAKKKEEEIVGESVSADENAVLVSELVSKLLTEVCTSYNHGIIFMDKTFGLSNRNQNHLMTAMLSHLSTQYSQPLVHLLVTGILSACPDQIQHFMKNSFSSTLYPRDTSLWVNNISFICKIYGSLQREMVKLKIRDVKSVEQLVKILLVYTFPPSHVLNMVGNAVRNKSILNNYVALGLVRQFLETAITVLKALDNTSLYTPEHVLQVKHMYKATVLKTLPDVMSIFGCWDKVITLQNVKTGELKSADIQTLFELSGASLADVLVTVEQVLCLYQDLNPALLVEHSVILGKLLDGILVEQAPESRTDTDHLTKMYLLKLLAGTDARRLPWSKKNTAGHTLLYQLLDMVTQLSTDSSLSGSVMALVCKLLESTGQFDDHRDDLLLWLQVLQRFGSNVLDFVSKVMMTYIHNPYPYMDTVSDLDNHVPMETDTERSQPISAADVLKMDAVDLEGEEDLQSTQNTTSVGKRFPFCPMLLVAMENITKDESPSKDVRDYVSAMVLHTFHLQVDPRPFCHWLKQWEKQVLVKGVWEYIHLWTNTKGLDLTADEITPMKILTDVVDCNDRLAAPADTLKHSIQYQLLLLTFLVNNLSKATEKVALKHIKTTLKTVMIKISTVLAETATGAGSTNADENKSDIFKFETSDKLDTISAAIRLVLNHPLVQKNFLCEMGNQSKKVSKVITDCVVCLLTAASKNRLDFQESMEFYYTKTEETLEYKVQEKSMESALDVLKILIETSTDVKTVSMLRLLLSCECSDDIAKAFQTVMENIMKKLVSSGIKHIKFTDGNLTQMFACFLDNETCDPDTLYKFMQKFPVLAALCTEDCLMKLLPSASRHCRLLQLLLQNNMTLTLKLVEMIQGRESNLDLKENLSLVATCLKLTAQSASLKEHYTKTCTKVVKTLKPQLLNLCGSETVDSCTDLMTIFQQLKRSHNLGSKLQSSMEKKLLSPGGATVAVQSHHVEMLQALFTDDADRRTTLARTCLRWLVPVLTNNTDSQQSVLDKILEVLSAVSQESWKDVVTSWSDIGEHWSLLIKALLKHQFTNPMVVKLITCLIPVLYRDGDLDLSVTIATVVDMVTSHSLFLPVMFAEHGVECKGEIVELLSVLIELSPLSCHTDHVGIYLGAYGASLSITDQKILKLLRFYEKNEISFSNYKPYVWGEKGIEMHTLRKSLGPSLKQPNMTQVLDVLDTKLLHESILHFPLRRKLQVTEVDTAEYFKSKENCYDPCFILPLFSYLLGPATVIDCRKFVETGCLGYTMAGLSSHDEDMRCAALHVLDQYQSHLVVSRMQEKDQLTYLLELLQNSLPTAKCKLASIISQFLARAAALMLKPDEHMYVLVNSYLLLKPSLDIQNIPEFFKLFNSSDLQYKVEQGWILSLMHDGLRETADYRIFEKRFTFKLVQGFFDSAVADYQTQLQVLQILIHGCQEKSVVKDLCHNHGFMVWLALAINKLVPEKVQMVGLMTRLVNTIWSTLRCENQSKMTNKRDDSQVNQSKMDEMGANQSMEIEDQSNKSNMGEHSLVNQSQTGKEGAINQSMKIGDQSKHMATLHLCTQLLTCLKNLLFFLRNAGEPVHLLFAETMLSVVKHMADLSHNSRGHVIQTVSHLEIFLLIVQCQNKWTQSKVSQLTVQKVLSQLEVDSSRLFISEGSKKSGTHTKKWSNLSSEKLGNLSETAESAMEVDDVHQPDSKSTKQTDDSKLSEVILNIILEWKRQTDYCRTLETAVVDFVVLQWLLDHIHTRTGLTVEHISAVLDLFEKNILSDKPDSMVTAVLSLDESQSEDIVTDCLRMYALIAQRFETLSSVKEGNGSVVDREQLVGSLNRILLTFYRNKQSGMSAEVKKLVKGSKELAEVKSLAVRKLFL